MNNINTSNSMNFTGKSRLLRDADWVCRKVKTTFPAISPNRLYRENAELIMANPRFEKFIYEKGAVLMQDRRDRKFLSSPFNILSEIIYSAKEHKVAHCAELSSLAEMVARMNGVKNCYRFSMKDYDHSFLLISENPVSRGIKLTDIIIDPWLGISGRVKNIFMQYEHQYGKIFPFDPQENVVLNKRKPLDLNDNEIKFLREKFPELVFNSRDGHELMTFG